MAEIKVERKQNKNWWIWVIVVIAILLAWWFFMRNNNQMNIVPLSDSTMMEDTSTITRDTAIINDTINPLPD